MNNNSEFNNVTPLTMAVNGFIMSTPEAVPETKNYFGLKSDINSLTRFQEYFRVKEKRGPYVDELRLIDNIISSSEPSPNDFILTELTSNDKRIGEAFDDVIKKLADVSGATYPYYTPDDILNAVGLCLSALGKNPPIGIKLFSGKSSLEYAAARESGPFIRVSSASGQNFTVAVNSKSAPKKDVNDSDLLMFLKAPNETPQNVFCISVSALLAATYKELNSKVFSVIDKGGLIEAVLSLTQGAFLNLAPLYQVFYNVSPELLTSKPSGSAIAVIPASKLQSFTEAANANGLYAYPIGRPAKNGRLNITSAYSAPYSLTYDFLRSLKAKNGISVNINESFIGSAISEKFNVNETSCEYAYLKEGVAIVNAESASNSYNTAVLTLLDAVSRAASLGISRKDMLVSFSIGLEFDSKSSAGNGFAAILGICKAQSELAVSSSEAHSNISDSPYCSVTLAAICKRELQNQFRKKGSRVYLLAPRYGEDGLPDFKDVRLLLDYVNMLWQNGDIISSRAISSDGAESAIAKMNNESVTLKMPRINEASGVGSFIVETDFEISGLFLGFTE